MERLTHERCSSIKSGYWSPAKKEDLVQRLGAYEDTGLTPEEIFPGLKLADIACAQIRIGKVRELLEQAAEEIENCYGRETKLTETIRDEIMDEK